jgi:prevent-host-death family protein
MTTTAADANRHFSALLRRVRLGRAVTITSHGRPVARMVPIDQTDATGDAARALLFARLKRARLHKAARWTRDELYVRGR